MLSIFLIALGLATIGHYPTHAARAVSGLEVSLSTPTDKVASASELRVIATVKNVGDEDLKVLKFGTVLDHELRTPIFIIRKDSKEVRFTRDVMVSDLVSRLSEDHPSEDDWLVIPAGETVSAEHNVSTAYDFSTTGPGTFTFDTVSRFRVVGLGGTVKTNIANTNSVAVTVTDGVSEHKLDLRKRATVDCFKPDWAIFLGESLRESSFLAHAAHFYVYNNGPNDQLYKDYFGTNDPKTVVDNFFKIIVGGVDRTMLYCQTEPRECEGFSFYYTQNRADFYFCPGFFDSSPYDRICGSPSAGEIGIRGGEMIGALAYATILDIEFKTDICDHGRQLSNDDKLRNVINYRCFALEAYQNTDCH